MADQGVSSLSNIVVAVIVARSVSAAEFGAFGVAMVVYQLGLGLTRAAVTDPLLSQHSHEPRDARARHVPRMVGSVLTLALALSVVVFAVGLVLNGPAGQALVALAWVLPLALVQDLGRYIFVIDRPQSALVIDSAWLVGIAVAMPLAPADAGVGWFVAAWGLSAGVGGLIAAFIERPSPRSIRPIAWLADEREASSRYVGEWMSSQLAGNLTTLAVGPIAGLPALGAVRAVQVLYGPLNTLHAGIYLAVVPDGARIRNDRARLRRLMVASTALIVAAAAVWMIVCVLMPDSFGESLFGASWARGSDLVVPMGLAMIVSSAATGGFAGIRALGDPTASLRARLATMPGELAAPVSGVAVGGASGFVYGLVIARSITSAVWWRAFDRAARRLPVSPAAASPTDGGLFVAEAHV
jgi:O-antigen/teichoic acid export membrane protein